MHTTRPVASLLTVAAAMAAVLFALSGCVIGPEGVEDKEVLVPDIFPPSKTVASYVMVDERPKPVKGDILADQLGSKLRDETMRKWDTFSTHYCDYGLPKRAPKVRVTVTAMTMKLKAYGAYTNIRPGLLSNDQYVKIGTHATLDDERLFMVHDRYLIVVRDLGQTPAEQRRALLINFARMISARIPRSITDLDIVQFLPSQDRVLASERLDLDDPLGLSILTGGAVSALYRNEAGREAKVFLARAQDTILRKTALGKLKLEMEKDGKVSEGTVGDKCFIGKLKTQNAMIAQREDVVYGVMGTMDEKEMQEMMAVVDRKIKPFVPTQWSDVLKKEQAKEERLKKGQEE